MRIVEWVGEGVLLVASTNLGQVGMTILGVHAGLSSRIPCSVSYELLHSFSLTELIRRSELARLALFILPTQGNQNRLTCSGGDRGPKEIRAYCITSLSY